MEFIRAFPILIIIAVCLIFLTIKRHRLAKKLTETEEEYLKREHDANFARKQDISKLPYVKIPADICSYDSEIAALAAEEKSILNLSGQSNTDLKLAYGVANLEILTKCDDNYAALVKKLNTVGKDFLDNNNTSDATRVLEYAVEIGSDISTTYEMLANIYNDTNDGEKINALRESAMKLNSIQKETILKKIGTP